MMLTSSSSNDVPVSIKAGAEETGLFVVDLAVLSEGPLPTSVGVRPGAASTVANGDSL